MVHIEGRLILLLAGVMAVCLLLLRQFDPARPSGKLLVRWVSGLALVWAWQLLPLPSPGMNPLSALAAGCLGVPGAALAAFAKLLTR